MQQYIISEDMVPLAKYDINCIDDPELEFLNLTLFVTGCNKKCKNCQNESLQKLTNNNHKFFSINDIKKLIIDKSELVDTIVFCGGDFLPIYSKQLKKIVEFCKINNFKTVLYTGELFESIDNYFKDNINIVIDGIFDNNNLNSNGKFPASKNQRCFINGVKIKVDELPINKLNI